MAELIQRLKKIDLLSRYSLNIFLVLILSMLMCMLAVSSVNGQGLACDNLVNVSLDDNCEAEITPGIIIESANIDEDEYTITITDQAGNTVSVGTSDAWPTVDGTNVGQTLKVSVEHTDGSECWGNILVEAKHGRLFENCDNGILVDDNGDAVVIELTCGELDMLDNLTFPALNGSCPTLAIDSSFVDEYSNTPCPSTTHIDVITRNWTITAANGYQSTCAQTIQVLAPTLANITWPPHYDSDILIEEDDPLYPTNRMRLSCDFIVDTSGMVGNVGNTIFNADGSPSPESTGFPSDISCRNIQFTYKDIFIPLCGNGFKILREWSILNWCTGEVVKYHQVIKMVDDRGPVATCPTDDIIVDTDPWSCTGTLNPVPDPILIFDCSATSYTVAYKLRDESGNPFENPITDNVVDNGNGTFGITDLPNDTTWLVYTITDECGFSTQCFTEIVVEDTNPPNAICEQNTIVSLDQNGIGKIPADRFDDHSFDNCGIMKFQARKKDDTVYQDTVSFDCSDISNEGVRIAMRAYDGAGLFGECWVTAKVQNKIVNVLESCPQDVTINCDASTEPSNTGSPVLDESCISAGMEFEDTASLQCGEGSITRLWTITDALGNHQNCIQTITVTDADPFTELDIKWPENLSIDGCTFSSTDPDDTGRPEFVNLDCVDLSVGYEDELFDLVDGCKKVIREWTVIDWCRHDANFPQDRTRWSFFQSITISNSQAPTFITGCDDFEVMTSDDSCEREVTLMALASDDCTPASNLSYRWELDMNFNGTFARSDFGFEDNETRVFPIGTHAMKWFVTDECGNVSECTQVFTVVDNSTPSFSCLGALSLSLGPEGWTEIWADDYVKDITAKCDGTDLSAFTFSFDEDEAMPNFKIDCAHFFDFSAGGGVTFLDELRVYLMRDGEAIDFCSVTLKVTDNFDLCPDFNSPSAQISGKITTENNEGLQDFEVLLKNRMNDEEVMSMTSVEGDYAFDEVALYDDYMVRPDVEGEAVNGVSTLDLVLIQKHILGLKPLDSPYKQIAADINQSGNISASDLVFARKLILGLIDEMPDGHSWRFVDASHSFESENGMVNYPEHIDFQNVIENQEEANFIGIKIGDVNESVKTSARSTEVRSRASVTFDIKDISFDAGEEFLVPIKLGEGDINTVHGLQLELQFNERIVDVTGLSAGGVSLDKSNYIINEGTVKISWNSNEAIKLSEDRALFYINIKTKTKNQFRNLFEVNEDLIASEFIDEQLEVRSVELSFGEEDLVTNTFKLFQNRPNPFSEKTTVSFYLPENGNGTIRVFDTEGRLVMQRKDQYSRGYNELELDFQGVEHNGILYLNFISGNHTANMKMVLID